MEKDERRQDAEFHAGQQIGSEAKPAVQARQGVATGRVMTILLAGVILVVIGFAVSYLGAV